MDFGLDLLELPAQHIDLFLRQVIELQGLNDKARSIVKESFLAIASCQH